MITCGLLASRDPPVPYPSSNGLTESLCSQDPPIYLAWDNARIFIKPLPEFLLCHTIWEKHLSKVKTSYEAAAGLLLSYLWLEPTKLDLKIAQERNLLPNTIAWQQWVGISRTTLQNLDFFNFRNINVRYRYGDSDWEG